MDIFLICVSTVLFSLQFLMQDKFQKNEGTTFSKTIICSFFGSIAGILLLFLIEGFCFEVKTFSIILAFVTTIQNLIMIYCGIKVLSYGNLSLYSLFNMIGGMLIPFLFGIIFCEEPITWQKCVCVVLVTAALFIGSPKSKKENKIKSILPFALTIFFLNGLSGVFSKIHQSVGELATSAEAYTMWQRIFTILICLIYFAVIAYKKEKIILNKPVPSILLSSGNVALNMVANLLLLYALLTVDASIQYPIVTGGVIVLSMITDWILKQKPSKKVVFASVLTIFGLTILII